MTFASRTAGALTALALTQGIVTAAQAEPSASDLASARALFKEGRALRERGDVAGALEKFQAAHALGQTPITGIELARTYVQLGRLVEAEEVSLGVSRIPIAVDETERSRVARREAAELAASLTPRLATLIVSIHGLPAGVEPRLTIDGREVPAAAIGEPRQADPGKHVAELTLPNGASVRGEVQVGEGESRALVLEAAAPAPAPVDLVQRNAEDDSPVHYYEPTRSPLLLSTGVTLTGIGLTAGITFGIAALSQKSNLDGACPGQRCGPHEYQALDAARTNAMFSNVGFAMAAAGAVIVAIDVYLRIRGTPAHDAGTPQATLTPDLGPGWLGAHGTF
ncbi:MAG TPA: hypothetical protein VGI39_42150 [Polyangiaceae bacterium]|jgi:hypothetical protein